MPLHLSLAVVMDGRNAVKSPPRIVRSSSQRLFTLVESFYSPPSFLWASTHNHIPYLVSVDYIEELTELDFLTVLPDNDKKAAGQAVATCL